ncbi:MAG: hypothetical protein RH860_01895 [Cytophagales bacterium]
MKRREEFEKKVSRSLNSMDAKISFLNEGIKGLSDSFKIFREDMGDYMAFTSDQFSDHEKRIKEIEKKLKK